MPVTFYSFKADMHERDELKKFIASLDGVGSIYFNFEIQKVWGLFATTRLINDIKPNAVIENVSKGLNYENYSSNSKDSDFELIN